MLTGLEPMGSLHPSFGEHAMDDIFGSTATTRLRLSLGSGGSESAVYTINGP
ncbi:hypothetical protein SAMN02745161_1380 [Halodesulfovibrio marinisediminis DSM 17456]|uniref:Uncharacterized protein n=1 Tax=Halodesulfovibrio marinisediminis DSM 17456 TaxID=1121457 RepID=A0A1N6FLN6_9BACT|nr:hypothetical protein SAMN02745161_1380 [Halodesulfovibrio marinisediminis DSM 17456]